MLHVIQTGEAIVLAPSGLESVDTGRYNEKDLSLYGRRWISVKTRMRITKDGGASILVVD